MKCGKKYTKVVIIMVKKRLIITFNIKVINSTIQYYFKKSEQKSS